jgi:hypothetical protein
MRTKYEKKKDHGSNDESENKLKFDKKKPKI